MRELAYKTKSEGFNPLFFFYGTEHKKTAFK